MTRTLSGEPYTDANSQKWNASGRSGRKDLPVRRRKVWWCVKQHGNVRPSHSAVDRIDADASRTTWHPGCHLRKHDLHSWRGSAERRCGSDQCESGVRVSVSAIPRLPITPKCVTPVRRANRKLCRRRANRLGAIYEIGSSLPPLGPLLLPAEGVGAWVASYYFRSASGRALLSFVRVFLQPAAAGSYYQSAGRFQSRFPVNAL
jgi:hypothetical protein